MTPRTVGHPGGRHAYERFHRRPPGEHLPGEGADHLVRSRSARCRRMSTPTTGTRPHRARGMEGRTPYRVFKKGIRKPRTPKKSTKKEVKTAA